MKVIDAVITEVEYTVFEGHNANIKDTIVYKVKINQEDKSDCSVEERKDDGTMTTPQYTYSEVDDQEKIASIFKCISDYNDMRVATETRLFV